MNITVEKIGSINLRIDAYDEYFLITDKDHNDLDMSSLDEYLYDRYAYESSYPGDWFCTMIYSMPDKFSSSKAIAVFCHRQDV